MKRRGFLNTLAAIGCIAGIGGFGKASAQRLAAKKPEYLIAHASKDPFRDDYLYTLDSLTLLTEAEYEALKAGTSPPLAIWIGPRWKLVEVVR